MMSREPTAPLLLLLLPLPSSPPPPQLNQRDLCKLRLGYSNSRPRPTRTGLPRKGSDFDHHRSRGRWIINVSGRAKRTFGAQ